MNEPPELRVEPCPDLGAWECLASGDADPGAAESMRRHLGGCPECRALHESLARNEEFLGVIRPVLEDWRPAAAADFVGATLGRYRVVGLLGVGGMASVYEAEQDRPARRVALKVIQGGMVTPSALRRFELEAELLGRLQHPGIARVYDAGTVPGPLGRIAYIAMERVHGERITQHAQRAGLGVRERLALLARVCDAVEHAHQRSVIHRDLKPGNILVDEHGQPKVLDFGIARVLDADVHTTTVRTGKGDLVGTVAYMSPEQAGGRADEVDTRSDVYALGVVGYELLTGSPPYPVRDAGLADAVRMIAQREPAPMRPAAGPLHADVRTIIGKALSKAPAARYASAGALAADIRRYLASEPISARAPTPAYHLARFARRHRGLVAAAGAVAAALVLGLGGTGYGLVRARAERDAARQSQREAERRRDAAERVTALVQSMLSAANPHEVRGQGYTVRQLLDDAARTLDALAGQPEVEAALRSTVGNAYRRLGASEQARPHLERAAALHAAAGDARALAARRDVAWLLHDQARYAEAAAVLREVLEAQRRALGPEHAEVADTLHALSDTLRHTGAFDESLALGREALEMRRRLLGERDPAVGEALSNLSKLSRDAGRYDEAESLVREAFALWRDAYPRGHPRLVDAGNDLGWLRYLARDMEAAEAVLRDTLEAGERILGPSHPDVGTTRYELAQALVGRGRMAEAEACFRAALGTFEAAYGEDHPSVATTLSGLSNALRSMGRSAEAEAAARRAVGIIGRTLGEQSTDYALALQNLGAALRARGDLEQAERAYADALAIHRQRSPSPHPHVAEALNRLGLVRQARGDPAGAEDAFREAVDVSARASGEAHADTAWYRHSLGALWLEAGRAAEAEPVLGRAVAEMRAHPSTWRRGEVLLSWARCLQDLGRLDAAEPAAAEAAEVLAGALGERNARTAAALERLASIRETRGDAAGAAAARARIAAPGGP